MIKMLDVKAVEKMLENGNVSKVQNFISEKRLTGEAVKYVMNNQSIRFSAQEVSKFYEFSEVYKDYKEFLSSEYVKYCIEDGAHSANTEWMTDFPKNSEELLGFYKEAENAEAVFKTVCYRKRGITLRPEIKDAYCNCYNGIIEIIKDYIPRLEHEEARAIEHYIQWGHSFNQEILKSILDTLGKDKTIEFLLSRVNMRHGILSIQAAQDLLDITTFFDNIGEFDRIFADLLRNINPVVFSNYSPLQEVKVEAKSILQRVYDTFLKKKFKKSVLDVCLYNDPKYGTNFSAYMIPFAFEKDEEVLFNAFKAGLKTGNRSIGYTVRDLIYSLSGVKINTTKEIQDLTVLLCGFDEIILHEEINNAEDFIKLIKEVDPLCRERIQTFNVLCKEKIKIQNFSDMELDELEEFIDWNYTPNFFKRGELTIDFLKRVEKHISFLRNLDIDFLMDLGAEDLIWFISRFDGRCDRHTIISAKQRLLHSTTSNTDPALVANIIKEMVDRSGSGAVPFSGEKQTNCLKLQTLLTYL